MIVDSKERSNQGAAYHRLTGQVDGSDNLSATVAADRALPAAFAGFLGLHFTNYDKFHTSTKPAFKRGRASLDDGDVGGRRISAVTNLARYRTG